MSQAVESTKQWDWQPGRVPESLQHRLQSLRRAIAGSLWLSGIARLSLILAAVILVDFLLDYLFHMDRSQRVIMACLIAGGLGYAVYRFLVTPLSQQASDDALVLTVEQKLALRHNPLINTLQLAREAEATPSYSAQMARHVVDQGLNDLESVDFAKALNAQRKKTDQWWLILGLAALLILGSLVATTELGQIWFRRNLLLGNEKWPTRTRLSVEGAADGVLVIPRGEDHLLRVLVDPDSAETNVDVYVDFMNRSTGTRQKLRVDEASPLEHLTTLRSVNSEFRFQVIGGDYRSDPIQIRLVEPPGFSQLELTAIPPNYSGLPAIPLPLSVENYQLMEGSQLKIVGQTQAEGAQLVLASGPNRTPIPLDNEGHFETVLSGQSLQAGRYLLDLQNADGIASNRPVEFSLEVIEDRPPTIRARAFGVTSIVMNKAQIPISVSVEDEFAVTEAGVLLQAGAEDAQQTHNFPADSLKDQWGQQELRGDVFMDLQPLDIVAGMTVNLTVQATDNQPADRSEERRVGKSKPMIFQVVTEAEFRADLLRREMEQTKVFEKLIDRQQKLLTEMNVLLAAAPDPSETKESFAARRAQMGGLIAREQSQIATLLVQINDRFRGFLDEVIYNRVDDGLSDEDAGQRIGDRLDSQIVQPLQAIDTQSMPELLRGVEWVARSTADDNQLAESLQDTSPKAEQVLVEMKAVLNAMQRSQSFQELINDLIAIKREEERLKKQAEQKRKESDSALEEIFD